MVVNCSYELLNSRLLHPYIFFNVCRKPWRQSVRDCKEDSQEERLTTLPGSLVFSKRPCAARPSQAAQDLGLGSLKWEVNTFVTKSKDLEKPGSLKERLWCHVESVLWLKWKLCFWVFPVYCLVRRLLGPRGGGQLGADELWLFWREKLSGPCLRLFQVTLLETSQASQLSDYHWV